ncbi:MAG: hypothetical protein M3680_17680 [Myxococcota bacterium]|nr:hypothetical protein [Myxococcota bacterium]
MIPYEDLVVALSSWRVRQGLPVSHVPAPLIAASTGGSGPARTAPPMAPPNRGFVPQDEPLDVDDAALLEEAHYENEGDDFAMKFDGSVPADDESTAIGAMPERESFGGSTAPGPTDDDAPPRERDRNEDW